MVPVPREYLWLALASWLLGLVMLVTAGIYDGPLAEPTLLVVLATVGIVAWRWLRHVRGVRRAGTMPGRAALLLVWVLLASFAAMAIADRRLLTDALPTATGPLTTIEVTQTLSLALLASYLPSIATAGREGWIWREARFAGLAFLLAIAGVAVMKASPSPHIDVWSIHTSGAEALARGLDPYRVVSVPDTGPGTEPLSFVYPPSTLYAMWLGWKLGHEVRFTSLAALLVTGLALRGVARTGRVPGATPSGGELPALAEDAPALLLWLTPKCLFFIEQSWNDILPLAFTALALLARMRSRPILAGVLLGVALPTKQSMFWVIPLALLLRLGPAAWAAMIGVSAALVVPFAVWDFRALKYANLEYHSHLPPRADALSPMNYLWKHFGIVPRSAPGFVLGAVATLASLVKLPRGGYPFALATTLVFLVFFVFNKWAFMNYYFFLAGLAALAAAAVLPSVRWRIGEPE